MAHKNYFQIEASDERDAGYQIGKLFQNELQDVLEYSKGLGGWQRSVNEALPLLSATKNSFPQIYQELIGQAEGAKISLNDLWAIVIEDELDSTFKEKCTTVVTNDGLLVGHNEDWDTDSKDYITVLKKSIRGVTTLELFYIGTLGGNSISVNSHGNIQAINSLDHKGHQAGVPKNMVAFALATTSSPLEDLRQFARLKRSSGHHHFIGGRDGQCFSLESTSKEFHFFNPKLPFIHTNHYITDLKKHEETENLCGTYKRYERANELVKPHMNIDEMKLLLDDKSDGKRESIHNERTIAKALVDLENMKMDIWLLRESNKGWVSYPLDFVEY